MRINVDKKGEEDLNQAFEKFLAACERVQEEVNERAAETGQTPDRVLFGVDRKNRRVSIVPVDPPSPD
jgi:hypothetical protein